MMDDRFTDNVVAIFKQEIELKIRKQLVQDITETLVAEYKRVVETELNDLVKGITIDHLERMAHVMRMRDELEVYVKIKNENNGDEKYD